MSVIDSVVRNLVWGLLRLPVSLVFDAHVQGPCGDVKRIARSSNLKNRFPGAFNRFGIARKAPGFVRCYQPRPLTVTLLCCAPELEHLGGAAGNENALLLGLIPGFEFDRTQDYFALGGGYEIDIDSSDDKRVLCYWGASCWRDSDVPARLR